MSMEYIRKYGVPAKRGRRIYYAYSRQYGTITSAKGGRLRIRLDGEKRPQSYHPTWMIDYLGDNGEILYSSCEHGNPSK